MPNHNSPFIHRDLAVGDALTELIFWEVQRAVELQEVRVEGVEPLALRYPKSGVKISAWDGSMVGKRIAGKGRALRALLAPLRPEDGEGVAQALSEMLAVAGRSEKAQRERGQTAAAVRMARDVEELTDAVNRLRAHGPVPRKG